MKLDKKLEEKIKKEALIFLKRGKPDWDVPHTLCAVKWMKELIKNEGGNERILLPAIYLHDIGYPKLQKNYSYEDSNYAKKDHSILGANISTEILKKLKLDDVEIKRISYLIKNHTIHNNIKESDRQLVYESDRLAQIDVADVKPNFDKKNCIKWLEDYYLPQNKYIRTKTGKKHSRELLKSFKKYVNNLTE